MHNIVYSDVLSEALQLKQDKPRSKVVQYVCACFVFISALMFTNETAECSFSPYVPEPARIIRATVRDAVTAYVSFIKTKNSGIEDDTALAIVQSSIKWAKTFRLDEKMILAIIAKESTFDQFAISSSGALGLMQIVPRWHLDKIKKAKENLDSPEIFNVDTNIYIGTMIYKDCANRYKQVSLALKCYEGTVDKNTGYDSGVLTRYNELKKII